MPGDGGTKITPKVLAELLAAALPPTQLSAGTGDPPVSPGAPGQSPPRVWGAGAALRGCDRSSKAE